MVERFLAARRAAGYSEPRHAACDGAADGVSARAWGGAAGIVGRAVGAVEVLLAELSRVSGGRAWVDGGHDRGVRARGPAVPGGSRA